MKIETRELRPENWNDLAELFGSRGACGGCWCMSWRAKKGENWNAMKGAEAKKRFRALVVSGAAHGILAYDGAVPVGWCSFDKRRDYSRLDRAPSFKCPDADQIWSIPCFFVKKEYRGQGVGTLLLRHALKAIQTRGGTLAEGYPAKSYNFGTSIPAAFAWTGTQSLFKKAGFKPVGSRDGAKQRVRVRF